MGSRKLIYLDDVTLTYLSGAKQCLGPRSLIRALESLRVAVLSGQVTLASSFVHVAALKMYKHRGRRARMRSVLVLATVRVKNLKNVAAMAAQILKTGLAPKDSLHVACARRLGALLLTTDKQMLHLARRHPALFGQVQKPQDWARTIHGNEEE